LAGGQIEGERAEEALRNTLDLDQIKGERKRKKDPTSRKKGTEYLTGTGGKEKSVVSKKRTK